MTPTTPPDKTRDGYEYTEACRILAAAGAQITRFEMADFVTQARGLGVDYVGICCGAGSHHVRAMAEALGREVPAGKYSPCGHSNSGGAGQLAAGLATRARKSGSPVALSVTSSR
jgi:hypothetical protein